MLLRVTVFVGFHSGTMTSSPPVSSPPLTGAAAAGGSSAVVDRRPNIKNLLLHPQLKACAVLSDDDAGRADRFDRELADGFLLAVHLVVDHAALALAAH